MAHIYNLNINYYIYQWFFVCSLTIFFQQYSRIFADILLLYRVQEMGTYIESYIISCSCSFKAKEKYSLLYYCILKSAICTIVSLYINIALEFDRINYRENVYPSTFILSHLYTFFSLTCYPYKFYNLLKLYGDLSKIYRS